MDEKCNRRRISFGHWQFKSVFIQRLFRVELRLQAMGFCGQGPPRLVSCVIFGRRLTLFKLSVFICTIGIILDYLNGRRVVS